MSWSVAPRPKGGMTVQPPELFAAEGKSFRIGATFASPVLDDPSVANSLPPPAVTLPAVVETEPPAEMFPLTPSGPFETETPPTGTVRPPEAPRYSRFAVFAALTTRQA